MNAILQRIIGYSMKYSARFHGVLAFLSFIGYFSTIVFGFAPTSELIQESGFSTEDLQNAISISEITVILHAWQNIMPLIIRLSVLDYIFILMGVILFLSLHSLVIRAIPVTSKWRYIPILGILVTFLSRSMDALENLWTILLYSNPDNFFPILIPLLNITTNLKWIIVAVEYSMLLLGILGYLVIKKSKKKEN